MRGFLTRNNILIISSYWNKSCSKSNPQESIWKTIKQNILALILIYVGFESVVVVSDVIDKHCLALHL